MQAILTLGSNLGDRFFYLAEAERLISMQFNILKKSSIYETSAWGLENQADFLNQALLIDCEVSPFTLLDICQFIEKSLGRKREIKWGARTIDIDIAYFENAVISAKNLTIPHPFLAQRNFVLIPVVEIAPDFIHPLLQKTQTALLSLCQDPLMAKKLVEIKDEKL